MKALCELATIEDVRINIKSSQTFSLNPKANMMEIMLFSSQGAYLGKIEELIFAKWHDGELPVDPGEYDDIAFVESPVKFNHNSLWIDCKVTARLRIGLDRFAGELTDEQVAMMTGDGPEVEMPDIESEWRKLDAEETLEVDITFQGITPY